MLEYNKRKHLAKIEQRNYFKVGDTVEFFGPSINSKIIKIQEIFDEEFKSIDIVRHPRQIVYLKLKEEVYPNDLIRIKK